MSWPRSFHVNGDKGLGFRCPRAGLTLTFVLSGVGLNIAGSLKSRTKMSIASAPARSQLKELIWSWMPCCNRNSLKVHTHRSFLITFRAAVALALESRIYIHEGRNDKYMKKGKERSLLTSRRENKHEYRDDSSQTCIDQALQHLDLQGDYYWRLPTLVPALIFRVFRACENRFVLLSGSMKKLNLRIFSSCL